MYYILIKRNTFVNILESQKSRIHTNSNLAYTDRIVGFIVGFSVIVTPLGETKTKG